MANSKADLARRIVAALIDGIIAGVASVVPVIGALAGAVYTLTKDALLFELTKQDDWRNRSIGKRLLNLEVMPAAGGTVDWMTSIKRNAPLAIGPLVMIVPVLGWVVGPVIAAVFAIIEIVLVLTDAQGRRFGDRWAGTKVVDGADAPSFGAGSDM